MQSKFSFRLLRFLRKKRNGYIYQSFGPSFYYTYRYIQRRPICIQGVTLFIYLFRYVLPSNRGRGEKFIRKVLRPEATGPGPPLLKKVDPGTYS